MKRRLIFSRPFTILLSGENFYIAKDESGGFDREKGLLKCLAQENGITKCEIQDLIITAFEENCRLEDLIEREVKERKK